MNYKLVLKLTGKTLLVEGGAMLLPVLVTLLYREDLRPFLFTLPILLLVAVPAGGEPFPLAFVPWDWWEGLPLAGVDSLEAALPLIAQAGELTAQGAEL